MAALLDLEEDLRLNFFKDIENAVDVIKSHHNLFYRYYRGRFFCTKLDCESNTLAAQSIIAKEMNSRASEYLLHRSYSIGWNIYPLVIANHPRKSRMYDSLLNLQSMCKDLTTDGITIAKISSGFVAHRYSLEDAIDLCGPLMFKGVTKMRLLTQGSSDNEFQIAENFHCHHDSDLCLSSDFKVY